MNNSSFIKLIEQSIRKNWDLPALTQLQQNRTLNYKDFACEIDKLHDFFKTVGIRKGDKISIVGKNSSNWAIAFFATLSYGAVVVSVLHEFEKEGIQYIISHSDSKLLFIDKAIWDSLDGKSMPLVETVISLDDQELIQSSNPKAVEFAANSVSYFENKYIKGFFVNDVAYRIDQSEELALINYTSGTSSNPKGVMIPYRSLWSNTKFANDYLSFLRAGDTILCMLPMAHTYGLAFEILNSVSMGCHIHFLEKAPSPKILAEAFGQVRPKLILSVPLIIEKIITKMVFPKINRGTAKYLRRIPGVSSIVNSKIKQTLLDLFGGNLNEIIIGGAALNEDVEYFLRSIKFPFTVGYGLTECGPLISYASWRKFKLRSCGKLVDRMCIKVNLEKPDDTVGEIMVKGPNVMLGYYKNEEATNEVLSTDKWLKTGDLGYVDSDNFVFLKGRNKNMILGPSGQNIYPEEIEDKLNNSEFVLESLIIDEEGRLTALIVPDTDELSKVGIDSEQYQEFFEKAVIAELNKIIPNYCQVKRVKIMSEEFEKTPKKSIRRFKYQKNN